MALYCSIVTYVPALPWFYYFLFVVESSWRTTLTRAISLLSVDLNPMLNVINPRRACAARVIVLRFVIPSVRPSVRPSVLPSVCQSVTTFSPATRNKMVKKRYQQVQCHTGFIFKIAISVKMKVMA